MSGLESLLDPAKAPSGLSRASLASEAASRLRSLILGGEIAPGTHLVESSLARILIVSRGPIREALRILDREGLVVISPHKGAVVTEWSTQDLLDAYDVRRLLEIRAAERAAERAGTTCAVKLGALLNSWQSAAKAGDLELLADLDLEFHRAIWHYAANRSLRASLEQTIHPLQTVFYLNATSYNDLFEVVDLHQGICDAIATGDPSTARASMETHMDNSLEKARRHSERLQTP